MKILFVMNDGLDRMIEYEHTGILNAPYRRAVEIELTEEQIKSIGIRKLGVSCGKQLYEDIESISLIPDSHD